MVDVDQQRKSVLGLGEAVKGARKEGIFTRALLSYIMTGWGQVVSRYNADVQYMTNLRTLREF